jgi:hypothetical protein
MRKVFDIFYSRNGQKVWLILLILTPVILWILPGDFFDGEGFILCPSRLFFGIECFGCGITRSVMHMHHFQFDDAVFYNTLGLVVYPALIVVWIIWTRGAAKRLHYFPFNNK